MVQKKLFQNDNQSEGAGTLLQENIRDTFINKNNIAKFKWFWKSNTLCSRSLRTLGTSLVFTPNSSFPNCRQNMSLLWIQLLLVGYSNHCPQKVVSHDRKSTSRFSSWSTKFSWDEKFLVTSCKCIEWQGKWSPARNVEKKSTPSPKNFTIGTQKET